MNKTKISDEVELFIDKEKKIERIEFKKKHFDAADKFAIFFCAIGFITFPLALYSEGFGIEMVFASLIFFLMFGGLAIQILMALKENQVVEIHKEFYVIKKMNRPFAKEYKILKKDNPRIELYKLRAFNDLDFNYFLGIKHIVSLYSFKVPSLGGYLFFEHLNQQEKEWAINYLKKKNKNYRE